MIKVVCAVILREDKILITQRSEKMKLPLKWEFPGGKVEEGENEKEALIREIKEELKINIFPKERIASHIHDYGSFKINLIAFSCDHLSGKIELTEHRDFKFVNYKDLISFDLAEADLPILPELKNILSTKEIRKQ